MTWTADKNTIAIWFSCGAASAVAAKKTIELYGANQCRVINTPIAEEHADNLRFRADVEKWIGVEIETATNPNYPDNSADTVWRHRNYMAGVAGAPCTLKLKKEARYLWEKEHKPKLHVLGFTYDEIGRHENFIRTERSNVIPTLINLRLTKDDCFRIINEAGLSLPEVYRMGYPNANCIGCVKATSPTYWNHVRRQNPEVFAARAELSRELGARLVRVNNERVFLDELSPNAVGRPMKSMDIECGIFCEERPEF